MRAASVVSLDGPDGITIGDVAEPPDDDSRIRVAVEAAGVTFPDLLAAQGKYQLKPPLPFVPGLQAAGTVVSAPDSAPVSVGQRVCAFTTFGALAETVSVGPEQAFALPEEVSWVEGAAIPVNYLTADFVLAERVGLRPGQTVLVQGAAGGVGLATVQLARAMGAQVIAVTSTPEKAAAARESGAEHTVEVDGFRDRVGELTGGRGVDVVVDPVGGERFTDSLRCLAPAGRLVVVGFTAGEIPTVQVNRLLLRNTSVVGAAWGEWALTHPGFLSAQWERIGRWFADGTLRPRIARTVGLAETAEALRVLQRREAIGNVVVQVR